MNADKKKKSRIQGGWAAQQQNSISKHSKAAPSTDSGAAGRAWTSDKDNAVMTSGEQQRFTYQNVDVKCEPKIRVIDQAGEYIISTEPSGNARIKLLPQFIDTKDCDWMFDQLRSELTWQQKEVIKNGEAHLQPRLTSWVADVPYAYSGIIHEINPQWTPLLRMLKDRIEDSTGFVFNSLLANLYRDGHDHVSWHCDDEPELGSEPTIASLSFGDTRNFELRKKPPSFAAASDKEEIEYSEYVKIPLDNGALLIMDGATQLDWQHRVSREYHDRGPRINLTFRYTMSK